MTSSYAVIFKTSHAQPEERITTPNRFLNVTQHVHFYFEIYMATDTVTRSADAPAALFLVGRPPLPRGVLVFIVR